MKQELAIQHYKVTESWNGVHCEGTVFFLLHSLLFLDIIFDDTVPYVFQTPFQSE